MGNPATRRARHQEFCIGTGNSPGAPELVVVPASGMTSNAGEGEDEDLTGVLARRQLRLEETAERVRLLGSSMTRLTSTVHSLTDEVLLTRLDCSLREALIAARIRSVTGGDSPVSHERLPFSVRVWLLWKIVRLGLRACNTKFLYIL
ncbi:hypothetical protein P3T20_002271 [Paraburkholderia sp. GAS206C]